MSLGYNYQRPHPIIGSKSGTTRTSVALTSDLTDNRKALTTGGMSKVNIYALYTLGTSETSNDLILTIESSLDGTNWYTILNESTSGGTSTVSTKEIKFTGADTTAPYALDYQLDFAGKHIRVSAHEENVATNNGTIYVEVLLSGSK